jgi:hypothetical protein
MINPSHFRRDAVLFDRLSESQDNGSRTPDASRRKAFDQPAPLIAAKLATVLSDIALAIYRAN